jgi:hypothetical protein
LAQNLGMPHQEEQGEQEEPEEGVEWVVVVDEGVWR